MMQAAIQKNNLMKQPAIVSLKGGASGAEALMYMKSSDGDANKVLIAYSLIYMLPLSAKIPFNWRDLTPVVGAMDHLRCGTMPRDPKTVKDFIAAAKCSSSPFKMGGTGSKREDHVLTVFMEQNREISYLVRTSPAVRTGNWSASTRKPNVNPSGETRSLARRSGPRALRVRQGAHLLQDQGHRNAILERHPDLQGGGLDVQYLMLRAMFLPGKVTPEQQAFYVDLFQKVRRRRSTRTIWRRRLLPIFSPARTC